MYSTSALASVPAPCIITPITSLKHSSNTNTPNAHYRPTRSTETYPIKDPFLIEAIQTYFLTSSATERFKSCHTNLRNFLWFTLSINMGRRGNDTLDLKWSDIYSAIHDAVSNSLSGNYHYSYILERKTGKKAPLIFNSDAINAVIFYLAQLGIIEMDSTTNTYKLCDGAVLPDENEYVFSTRGTGTKLRNTDFKRNRVNLGTMNEHLQKAARAVGITYHVASHSLRKTFGYNLYKATGDIALVQKIFNHSTSIQSLTYIGITHETMTNAYRSIEGITNFTALKEAIYE